MATTTANNNTKSAANKVGNWIDPSDGLLETANTLGRGERGVLCACLPDEHHELGLLTVALRLATNGHHLAYLGPAVPYEDLQQACELIQPMAICLSVSRRQMFERGAAGLDNFARRYAGYCAVYLGGAGVPESDPALEQAGVRLWPPGQDLDELLEAIALDRRNQNVRSTAIH